MALLISCALNILAVLISARHISIIKLYASTVDDITVRKLTVTYSFSEMTAQLIGSSEVLTPSTVTPFSAVQEYDTNVSRSKTK